MAVQLSIIFTTETITPFPYQNYCIIMNRGWARRGDSAVPVEYKNYEYDDSSIKDYADDVYYPNDVSF